MYDLRAALAQWLREAVTQQNGAVMLTIVSGQPGSAASSVPTLLLIVDMLKQAHPPPHWQHVLSSVQIWGTKLCCLWVRAQNLKFSGTVL